MSKVAASICVLALVGCSKGEGTGASPSGTPSSGLADTRSGTGKKKPAPGTGNIEGRVLYDGKAALGIEVKLCEKFNRFIGGCNGARYTATTDAGGEYLIENVPPKAYEGLLAMVFDTGAYVFATAGMIGISAAKYDVKADQTLFVPNTNLFKSDLKTIEPKAGSKVSGQKLTLTWQPYPHAAYYQLRVSPESTSPGAPYLSERVEGTAYEPATSLTKGTYRYQVTAYNGKDVKLAESASDIKFTITDGPVPRDAVKEAGR